MQSEEANERAFFFPLPSLGREGPSALASKLCTNKTAYLILNPKSFVYPPTISHRHTTCP